MSQRVPRAIKKLRGTDRPDRARRDARPLPTAPRRGAANSPDLSDSTAGLPPPPSFLSKGARRQWADVVPLAHQINPKLCALDLPALVQLCECLSELQRIRERIEREGDMVKTTFGKGTKGHPLLRHLENTRGHTLSLLRSFGLTPDSRREPGSVPPPRGPGRGRLGKLGEEESGEEENYFARVKRNGARIN